MAFNRADDCMSVTMITDVDGKDSRAITVSVPVNAADYEMVAAVMNAFDWLFARYCAMRGIIPRQRNDESELGPNVEVGSEDYEFSGETPRDS